MKKILERAMGIIFPKVCPGCGKIIGENQGICEECETKVEILRESCCMKCGKKLQKTQIYCKECRGRKRWFDEGVSVFCYQGKLKQSIHQFKYENIRQFADYYGSTAWETHGKKIKEWNPDCIVPIPMFKKKEIQRGYNQAEVFARSLAEKSGIPLKKTLLIRKKNTKPQKGLTDERRMENLKGAFAVDGKDAKRIESVLLVDDIYTTGSTMDACAGLLKKAGVKNVYFLCIATGLDRES